ncbi:MAG: PEP-CTERM sorting domain-containing protein [Prosthecobacter sp.]|uniref:PEP-CTERM sorting domain-containing protein n=1 Tax=Prosthecobacter sp. TaxID=1965333 RepID=UPI0038FFE0EC
MKLLYLILTLSLTASSLVSARTINWGSAVSSSLYDSTGAALDDSYSFELGTFGSFVPTEFNMTDWLTNWKAFDRATAPAANGWNSGVGYFTSSATLLTDGTSSEVGTWSLPSHLFAANEQGFIWAYNTQTLAPFTTEWALFTNGFDGNAADDWLFPSTSDQTGLPLDWRLTEATFTPFGAINDTQGPGDYSVNPGTLDLQTHITPIPEPGSALLVALTGGLTLLRRRRP